MWETRTSGTPRSGGDALGVPPDSTRPSSPWPRLLAFAFFVLSAVGLAGICVVSFARPPEPELRVELSTLSQSIPRFLAVVPFGSDREGFTYGTWVTILNGRPAALLSKSWEGRCHVRWEPTTQAGGRTGVFVDPCTSGRYGPAGETLAATAPRDLDTFPTRLDGNYVVVDLTKVRLGNCRVSGVTACSGDGSDEVRNVPRRGLPQNFVRE